jgi:[ribosomal protein S5]-alanine N-acetyltransferase
MDRLAVDLPTLMSERLVLEPLSRSHSAGMFDMWREPEVCRFSRLAEDFEGYLIALPAVSVADSDKIIDFFVRGCAAGTWFRWALLTRAGGQFIGAAGFNSLGACS